MVYVGAVKGFIRLEMTAAISSEVFDWQTAHITATIQYAYMRLQEHSSYSFSECKLIKILSGSGTDRSKLSVNE